LVGGLASKKEQRAREELPEHLEASAARHIVQVRKRGVFKDVEDEIEADARGEDLARGGEFEERARNVRVVGVCPGPVKGEGADVSTVAIVDGEREATVGSDGEVEITLRRDVRSMCRVEVMIKGRREPKAERDLPLDIRPSRIVERSTALA